MTVSPWLLAVPLLPVVVAAAGLAALRLGRRDKELQRRILAVTGAEQGRPAPTARITRNDAGQGAGWKDRAAAVFGFALHKRGQYPVPWFWVVGVSLLLGRGAAMLAAPVIGELSWALMPLAAVLLSRAFFKRSEAKRQRLLREQLPDALGLIARAVRVGVPVAEALRAVSRESPEPTGGEFKQLAEQIAIGIPTDAALREMAARNELPEYGFFAAALGLQAQTGGALTETLDLLADVTRKRVALRARGRALSAEARTSALVLGALPVVMTGVLSLISPAYIGVLFGTPTGHTMLSVAVLLLAVGFGSMQVIIQKALA